MSSKPWHFVFFIFNSYSHTHSNLKRASSIPKLFFFFSHIFFFFFIILSFATIPPQYFTLFKFTSSKPCLFFYMLFFFFQARVRFPSFFSFFSLFCSYVLHYNLHTSHALKTWVRLPGLFLHIFYFTCSLLQLFFLHLKFFFYYTFFFPSYTTLLLLFFLFLSIIHTNKFLTLKQNANKIYLH